MPYLPLSDTGYRPPVWLRGGHAQTILPHLTRRPPVVYHPEPLEIPLPDGDVLEAELALPTGWQGPALGPSPGPLVILSHGLEGSTRSPYSLLLAYHLTAIGYRVLAWSLRGCGPRRLNRAERFYHMGDTDDLSAVIAWARAHLMSPGPTQGPTSGRVDLVGFSAGGNMLLRYLALHPAEAAEAVRRAVAISTPLDVADAARQINRGFSQVYGRRFLKQLQAKVQDKIRRGGAEGATLWPRLTALDLRGIATLEAFDDRVTAPLHGFASAQRYYREASSGPLIGQIARPTLIINADNDPFLGPGCREALARSAAQSEHVWVLAPAEGGHCGFVDGLGPGQWGCCPSRPGWLEGVVGQFLQEGPPVEGGTHEGAKASVMTR